jgi:chromosome partitioning protein
LIDCPPSLGLLTINALTAAADGVIVPIQCEYLALEGLGRLWQTVQLVRDNLNPHLFITGMILTMYDARTNLAAQVVAEVRKYFPHQTFQTVVPRNVRLSEAPSHGQTIMAYAPQSVGALAYEALAQELLTREASRSSPPHAAPLPNTMPTQNGGAASDAASGEKSSRANGPLS